MSGLSAQERNGADRGEFRSERARSDYLIHCAATFLTFLTGSQVALLAVVLERNGIGRAEIPIVLSANGVTTVGTLAIAGYVVARLGALTSLRAATTLMCIAYLSLELTVGNFWAAIASRLLQGIGFGLFMPAAMTYARATLAARSSAYLFGIYAAMVTLPNLVGPTLAELYLRHIGIFAFFVFGAMPGALAVPMAALLHPPEHTTGDAPQPGFASVLFDKANALPLLAIFVVGVMYGFVGAYMAPFLMSEGIAVGYFFAAFTISFFVARFWLLRLAEGMPRSLLIAAGLALMAIGYLGVANVATNAAVVAAGVSVGLGYSVAYPNLSLWILDRYEAPQRGMPASVFNAAYFSGFYLSPLVVGWSLAARGYSPSLDGLAALGFAVAAVLAARGRK